LLACTYHVGAVIDSSLHVKRFLQTYQFRSDAYRLYYLVLGTDRDACEQFHSAVDQKYLLRQIKALDGFLSGETVVGAATIVEEPDIEKCVPTHANPVLLTLYGHRLAAGGSFSAAQCAHFSLTVLIVAYYFRARQFVKDDALLELSIGLAYLHRAMQRQVNNRHISILQAMTFIFQYYQLQYTKSQNYDGVDRATVRQQAEYNVARAFHQVGLETFAVKYYENALRISEEFERGLGKRDLKFEAAHNLNLIFQLSGNIQAAKEITEKFLVL
jgi:general transcription factor 3C polypeptide 3 (transcription factor C subunit 4)